MFTGMLPAATEMSYKKLGRKPATGSGPDGIRPRWDGLINIVTFFVDKVYYVGYGAGHRNFRLALANYAGEAGLNGKMLQVARCRL
jgi:hypothetical protein